MVEPRAVTVLLYMGAALAWAAVAATIAAAAVVDSASVTVISAESLDNNNSSGGGKYDRRQIKLILDPHQLQQQFQPRKFRHEASAVRVLYQTGVSIFR